MSDDDTVRMLRARGQALAGGVRDASAAAVVRRVLAVQAQDATAADLGIRVRAGNLTGRAVRAAYEDERSIVRGWFMRGTLHTVPAEDVHALLRLLSPRTLAATGRRYQQLGLDDGLRERADRLIRRALTTHGPLSRAELTEHLTALGVPPDGQAPFHLIRHAALTGVLCHGPRRAGEATYVLLDDWLPAPAAPHPDEATVLTDLARRYLAAYAPATPQDFATWSGLPVTSARAAWKSLAQSGALADHGSSTVLAGRPHDPGLPSGPADVRLLPAYDGYFLAHRTRDVSVPTPTSTMSGPAAASSAPRSSPTAWPSPPGPATPSRSALSPPSRHTSTPPPTPRRPR